MATVAVRSDRGVPRVATGGRSDYVVSRDTEGHRADNSPLHVYSLQTFPYSRSFMLHDFRFMQFLNK